MNPLYPIVINVLGGPGLGKSTVSSEIFSSLKMMGINVEQVDEFAKTLTWEENYRSLSNQIYVFGNQHHKQARLLDKVRVIVTDSPLILSLVYGEIYYKEMSDSFKNLIVEEYTKFPRFDVLLERKFEYDPNGRNETENQALGVDKKINEIYGRYGWEFDMVTYSYRGVGLDIIEEIKKKYMLT